MAPTRPIDRGKTTTNQTKKISDESSFSSSSRYDLRSSSRFDFPPLNPTASLNIRQNSPDLQDPSQPLTTITGGGDPPGLARNGAEVVSQPSVDPLGQNDHLEEVASTLNANPSLPPSSAGAGISGNPSWVRPELFNMNCVPQPAGSTGSDLGYVGDGCKIEKTQPDLVSSVISETEVSMLGNQPTNKTNNKDNEPTEDQQLPRSYASIFKNAANTLKKGTLRFIPPKYNELGICHAVIPDDLLAKQNEEWLLTLVGHFIGKRPAFQFVRFHANRLWKQFGLVDVILNDQGYFYFKFRDDHGMKHVLENGPWLFNDIPVLLRSWQPGMWFDKPKPTEIPLWVNIYDIPVSLWSYDILSHIVSVIGKPTAVDRYTADMCEKKSGRAVFARILVEISAVHEIPQFTDAIILGTMRRFRLQYHWTPARCSHCKIFGHKFVECSERPRTTEEMEVRKQNVAPSDKVGPSGTNDQDFQQPKKRRRRPNKAQTTTTIHITTDKPKVLKVTQTEKSKSDSQATDNATVNNQTSDTSYSARIPSMDTVAPDTHPRTHDPTHHYNATTFSTVEEKEMVKENESSVGPDSSVVFPPTPLATKDCSNLIHATDYYFSWLDYVGPSTNEESDCENIWCYRDPTGKSHEPFSIKQLHNWSEYLPIDLKIWKRSGTEKESIHLHSALKRRAKGLKKSNVS